MLTIIFIQLKNCKIILTGFYFILIHNAFSQYSSEFNKYSKQYPEAAKVRLLQETKITIEVVKGKLEIKKESLEKDLYLNEGVNYASKRSLGYSTFFELEKIKASSFSYNEGKYIETEVEEFKEKDDLDDSFYDDSKSISFIYPNLKKGSISQLESTYLINNPRFLSSFYFGEYFPVIKTKVTLVVDNDVTVSFKEFNMPKEKLKFLKQEKRNKIIYTWELNNESAYDFEANSPSYRTVLPHIIPIINSYKKKNETVKLLGDVPDLYKWYYSLIKNVNKEDVDKELVEVVRVITKDAKSDLEKVKSIYYWVQKNIKYIAFEYALGGFIPRESNEVFRKKYGDCKDNSSILYRMLEIANLKGNLTWVGTRTIPYTYEEVPTPVVDNHMILSYDSNGKTYFLDATGRYIKFGLPTSFIQGKEALVSYGENKYEVKEVPIVKAKENAIIDSTIIKLENNKIVGTSITSVSGYPKIHYFNRLDDISKETDLKEFYNVKFSKGNNKFLILNLEEKNKYDYDANLMVDYDFEIENYSKTLGDEIYINLNLNKKLSNYKLDKKRKNTIEYDYKRFFSYKTVLEIPENYKVDYIPESMSLSNDFVSCSIDYELKNKKIIYHQKIELNYITLNLSEQKQVNDLIKKVEKNYKEIIVLKKQ